MKITESATSTFWKGEQGIQASVQDGDRLYKVNLYVKGSQVRDYSCSCVNGNSYKGMCAHGKALFAYYEDYAKDEKDKEWELSFYSGDIEDNIWYSDVLGTKVAKNTSNPQRQMFAFFLDNDMYCFRTTCYTDYYAEKVDKDEFEKLISSIKLRE